MTRRDPPDLSAGNAALAAWQVTGGRLPDLAALDPAAAPAGTGHHGADSAQLEALGARLAELQARLYAGRRHALLLVLQGMDASGKDGVIRRVFRHISPLGVRAQAFGVPVGSETRHDFLWRIHACTPALGEIAVFNRSHYEDVVAAPVRGLVDAATVNRRLAHIRAFEQLLVDEGTVVVKCFLHLSHAEQGQRLRDRRDRPHKRWKLQPSDLEDRAHWSRFQQAYAQAMAGTSTACAPWWIVPADSRLQRDLMVATLLVNALDALDLSYPAATVDPDAEIA